MIPPQPAGGGQIRAGEAGASCQWLCAVVLVTWEVEWCERKGWRKICCVMELDLIEIESSHLLIRLNKQEKIEMFLEQCP